MHVLKSFFISISMYSQIPVPQFEWKEEDMKYTFCFFPWVGALIGILIYFWNHICSVYNIGSLCMVTIEIVIPIFVTGGFHVDGFMDTMDAIHSYSPRERKLEILKDSHIGAFAVIMLAAYGLIIFGAFSEISNDALIKNMCCCFFLSRCFCCISVMSFPLAKKDGTLHMFAGSSKKNIVKIILYIQSAICICFMIYCSFFAGVVLTVSALFTLCYYFYRSRKEFGGITGDTAGFFILFCEGFMIVTAAIINILGGY